MQPAQRSLAFVALVITLAALAGTASAAELAVTRGDDDPASPQAGSLRAVLAAAHPGDVVSINVPTVRLSASISVPAGKSGVVLFGNGATITAAAGTPVWIDLASGGWTVSAVGFERVSLYFTSPEGARLASLKVTVCRFAKGAELGLHSVDGCVVGGPTDEDAVEFNGSKLLAVNCGGLFVGHNQFRKIATGFEESGTTGLRVDGNKFMGSSMTLAPADGVVLGNVIAARGLDALTVSNYPAAAGGPAGAVLISKNNIRLAHDGDGIVVIGRGGATVELNPIAGAAGSKGAAIRFDAGAVGLNLAGKVAITGNPISKCGTGIEVATQGSGDVAVDLKENEIKACAADGIVIRAGTGGAITTFLNKIEACGKGRAGSGMRLSTGGSTIGSAIDTVTASSAGIVVESAPIQRLTLTGVIVTKNRGDGIVFRPGAAARVDASEVRDNKGAGVFVDEGAVVEITRPRMSGDRGPGIDLAPRGVTPNEVVKTGNENMPWPTDLRYDPVDGKIRGKTVPNAAVELFAVETGARAGNPNNGEGAAWLVAVDAGADGSFVYPPGSLRDPCPPSGRLTCTARAGGATSEFSPDVVCLDVPVVSVELVPEDPVVDEETIVTATLFNPTSAPLTGYHVQVFDGKTPIIDQIAPTVPARTGDVAPSASVSAPVTFREKGTRRLFIKVAGRLLTDDDTYVNVVDTPTSPPPSTVPGVTMVWKIDGVKYATGDHITRSHTRVTIFEITVSNASPTFTSPGPTTFLLNEEMLHSSGGGLTGPNESGFPAVGEIQWGSTLSEVGPDQVFRLTVGGTELGRILIDVE